MYGIDTLIAAEYAPLRGQRIGLLTNHSAITHDYRLSYRVMAADDQLHLAALFAPEHGLYGVQADGEFIDDSVEASTGLPIYSLYGGRYKPDPWVLDNLDALVIDITDVGVRYYTFTWTASLLIESAAERGLPVTILDRPNPLNALSPTLEATGGIDASLLSLVGRYPVPIMHGLSIGELLMMVNARYAIKSGSLMVIPYQQAHDYPWVAPSPNMPNMETVRHYAGACLIEGTNLSEGRGTAQPFRIVGAPFINGEALADVLNTPALHAYGLAVTPYRFKPTASKYAGQICEGVYAHALAGYQPLRAWLHILQTIRRLYPEQFAFLPPYAPQAPRHFDRLIGTERVRQTIEADGDLSLMFDEWEAHFAEERPHLTEFRRYAAQ